MWGLLELSPWRVAVAIGWGVAALGSGLGLAALAAWLIARAWEMPPVLDLSVAVVAVRALGISRGLCRYLERLATHDVALRAMTTARTTVYRTLAQSDVWMRRDMRGGTSDGPADGRDGSGGLRADKFDRAFRPLRSENVSAGAAGLSSRRGRGVSVESARNVGEVSAFGRGDTSDGSPVAETDSTSADGAASLRRGDLLVRIGSDIDDLGAAVVRVFVPIAVAIVLSLAAIGLMATISVGAAAILAVSLGIAGIVAPWLSGWAARAAERAVRADRAEFTAQALTVLDHAAELRVAGKLDAALAAADHAGQRAVAAEDSAAARSAWAAAATPLSIGASVLGALLIGIAIYGTNPPAMTPMALTILVLLPLSAFEAVAPLPAAAQALTTARAALHRLPLLETTRNPMTQQRSGRAITDSAMNRPNDSTRDHRLRDATGRAEGSGQGSSTAGAPATPDRIGVDAGIRSTEGEPATTDRIGVDAGIRSSTEGEPATTDRRGIDAGIRDTRNLLPGNLPERPAGKRIAVVGPSGAGKTTLLMAWAGLFGTPVPGVTFFAEDAHIFGTSVLENLRVARGDLTVEAAEKALCAVGLGDWLASLSDGVHTDLVGGAAAVSGGQRRRILLARALISPARVLLLDEPTEHLEAEAGARLLRELLDIGSGLVEPDRTVVVVTHQLPSDHRAEAVLHIDGSGQVTTTGGVDERTGSAPSEIPLPTH
ncbi:ATP-binding cassette domain-containing protein [Nocardia pseudovaccinii]|uniref:ATP-binding cassette domain-containing protein n=1 Tax=Nocardia pseudovaccinii TaxID=189540 RepID=UPI000ABA2754|nr:ATP-binding cassette domain-containing protein [Nocardia pseudovaccinii]